ncbi:MAG: hypothetical protein P8R42_12380 [Candidatus Binatia bacterium]|nr:hypothetical protein [Candidatus Binatia bacterium]
MSASLFGREYSASSAKSVRSEVETRQPKIMRENTSMTNAT